LNQITANLARGFWRYPAAGVIDSQSIKSTESGAHGAMMLQRR
jgi:hypothetical protein